MCKESVSIEAKGDLCYNHLGNRKPRHNAKRVIRLRNMMKKLAVLCAAVMLVSTMTACGNTTGSEQEAYRQYGINCLENGKYEDAVEAFQKALDQSVGGITDKEIDICLYKAQAQFQAGRIEEAIGTYTALIEYNGYADAYYLRGNIYFSIGQTDLAIADYASAVKEDKDNYELYISIYKSLNGYGYADQANEYLNTALAIKGDSGIDKMQKGRIYALMGNNETALENLVAASDEGVNKANFYLGQVYAQMGEGTLSTTYFQAFIESGEADSYDLEEMGELQMNSGDYATAISFFKAAMEQENVPNMQKLMKNMVIAYEYSGDFASARDLMEEYIEAYPNDTAAQEEYTFLQTR